MDQVIAFANNQMIGANNGTSIITTDPVPLTGNDRASVILNLHYIFGPSAALTYKAETSNDGVHWVSDGPFSPAPITVAAVQPINPAPINGAFIRFEFTFTAASGVTGAACFDAHVRLDHA